MDGALKWVRRNEVPGLASVYRSEDLSPQIDGHTDAFFVSEPYVSGTLEVFINGLYQGTPGTHFSEASSTTFCLIGYMPEVGEELTVRYVVAS